MTTADLKTALRISSAIFQKHLFCGVVVTEAVTGVEQMSQSCYRINLRNWEIVVK
jgi:hypothetical protein